MSKVFFDYLIVLDDVNSVIHESAQTNEEKQELWNLVDNLVNHKVMETILDNLPAEKRNVFLERFSLTPHDEAIIHYLQENIKDDIEEIIKAEIEKLKKEILAEISKKK